MARNAIVYESRNRLTGTLMRTIDTRHPDVAKLNPPLPKRTKAQEGKRYAAMCVEHKTTVFFDEHYPAGRAIAHSGDQVKDEAGTQGWCPKCVLMVKENKPKITAPKAASTPSAVKAPAKTPAAKSNGKRTSNKTANRQASRRAAVAAAPGPVVTRTAEPAEQPAESTPEPALAGAES